MGTSRGTGLTSCAGPRAHRYRADRGARPGAFILPADAPGIITGREKLVCIGRRHPRYERVVTWESAARAYRDGCRGRARDHRPARDRLAC